MMFYLNSKTFANHNFCKEPLHNYRKLIRAESSDGADRTPPSAHLKLVCICEEWERQRWCRGRSVIPQRSAGVSHLIQRIHITPQSYGEANTDRWNNRKTSVTSKWEETTPPGRTEERSGDRVIPVTSGWNTPTEPRRSGWKWPWGSLTFCAFPSQLSSWLFTMCSSGNRRLTWRTPRRRTARVG